MGGGLRGGAIGGNILRRLAAEDAIEGAGDVGDRGANREQARGAGGDDQRPEAAGLAVRRGIAARLGVSATQHRDALGQGSPHARPAKRRLALRRGRR
jgi:hypothetical protein